jgi:hypothetical protein
VKNFHWATGLPHTLENNNISAGWKGSGRMHSYPKRKIKNNKN